jgi:hypothetical protein
MIFIATPITPLLDNANLFSGKNKERLSFIISSVRKYSDRKIFCAIEREQWGEELMPAHICTRLDLQAMIDSKFVLAFPSTSYGVHVELGWASALNKPIVLIMNKNEGYKSPLIEGVNTITPTITIEFISDGPFPDEVIWSKEVFPQLINAIKKIELGEIHYEKNT